MPAEAVLRSIQSIDLSTRFVTSVTVDGSPALAAETQVAHVALPANLAVTTGVFLWGWLAFTVGATGTATTVRIRQTGLSGTVVANSGALTATAAQLVEKSIGGLDASPVLPGQVYALSLQVTGGSGASTVSAVHLVAIAV